MRIGAIIIGALILFSCGDDTPMEKPEVKWTKDNSTNLNKELAEQEKIDIQLYLDRKSSWKMKESGSGLRYWIYKEGTGPQALSGSHAQVSFDISLLDGTKCYKTEEDEIEEFKVDKSQVETGVQEAIKLMREGDHAKLIIPSHLAHGLTGDMNKIPPLTPIVVDIELYKVR
jgi:FKBP-type peptidyl-prolyl cis-trans isomerase|tara:strand:- start:17115 stop:17630 length:516 start_codon:yes stop_codon:yes gene_type:complete